MVGTNFFTESSDGVYIALADQAGNATLVRSLTASIPSAVAGFAIGCILSDMETGTQYTNTGTAASCTFTAI
jgi:hypothetical protein